jgi:hypothetical protein
MALGQMTAQSTWSTTVARRRAELLGGIQRLERAIDAPISDPSWRPGMTRAVAILRAAFDEHVLATEGPSGLYSGLLEHAPRLARGLSDLVGDHRSVQAALDDLNHRLDVAWDADVESVRRQAAQVLRDVDEHRQRGADLVYEAYATDIGGET